jgi:GT2 family glycosyltransferase
MKHRVAIILVNWNSFAVTNDCIHSLKAMQYPSYKIIVVDNGSADGSGDALEQAHPGIILIRLGSNMGFTGGNNAGFRYALQNGFDFSIMLNNDTFVEPDFLSHLVSFMDANPGTGAIQPRIFFNHNRQLLWNGGSYYNKLIGLAYTVGHNKPSAPSYENLKQVDWITGCAFFIRNSVLESTGLLAENMFIYSEDVDLSFRIKQLGYSLIYQPLSVIYHIAGMSNRSKSKGKEGYVNPIVHYLNQRNRIWVIKKYTPWYCVPTVIAFNFFYITMVMGYFAARGRFTKFRSVSKAVRDGLTGSIQYNN